MEIYKVNGQDLDIGDNVLLDDDSWIKEYHLLELQYTPDSDVRMFRAEDLTSGYYSKLIIGIKDTESYYKVER